MINKIITFSFSGVLALLSQAVLSAEFVYQSPTTGVKTKVWISDASLANKTVRGVIVANGTNAGSDVYVNADYRALAAKWDFAMINTKSPNFATLMDHASEAWGIPVLAGVTREGSDGVSSLPSIYTGVSRYGQLASITANKEVNTAIAAVNYRGRFYKDLGVEPEPPERIPASGKIPNLSVMAYDDSKDDRTLTMEVNIRDGARKYWNASWTSVMHWKSVV